MASLTGSTIRYKPAAVAKRSELPRFPAFLNDRFWPIVAWQKSSGTSVQSKAGTTAHDQVTKTRINAGFFWIEIRSLVFGDIKPTLLNHPKHIAHILNQNPGDVGDGVDVVFCVIREASAGHEVEVFEDGVEAFADAVVEFAQWSVVVDEQDGVFGGELGHWGEAAGRSICGHKDELFNGL